MNSTFSCIGIDFGTSKSTMAWYDSKAGQAKILRNDEGEEKTPSIVYFGKDETLVGTHAEQMLEDQEDPEARKRIIISVKRSLVNSPTLALPGKRIKAVEVAAEILRKLKDDAEKLHFHQPVTHAVITCPAAFDLLQRDEIEKAGKLAGFSEVHLLEEPVAAALAYAHEGLDAGNYLLVYDLGGGTFDVAVLAREGDEFRVALEPKGMARCGGDDFDQVLYDYCDEVAQQLLGQPISPTGEIDLHFLRRCRERKENLSSRERIMFSSLLRSETGSVQFKQMIERTKFEELIGKYIDTTARLTKDILEESVASGCIVDTVVLIGGSSRVPLVQMLLKETLPVQPKEWQQRDMAVVLGAAYYANSLWGTERVVPHAGAGFAPLADELPVPSDGSNADGQMIHCPACGATNRVPQEKIVQGLAPVCGRCKTPLRVQTTPVTWNPQEQYRQAVEMAWADQNLQMEEGRRLVALADQLGLTKGEAADIERAVIGATKERVLEQGKLPVELSPSPVLPLQDFGRLAEAYLSKRLERLRPEQFGYGYDVSSGKYVFRLVARKKEQTLFGSMEVFFIFSRLQSPTVETLKDFSAACVEFVNKTKTVRSTSDGIASCFSVAIADSVSAAASDRINEMAFERYGVYHTPVIYGLSSETLLYPEQKMRELIFYSILSGIIQRILSP